MPGVVEHDGQRLPATYVNFYFVNGALLVPTYRHKKNDRRAMEILQYASAEAQGDRHRLRGVDLGPGRDPLPDAAAADGVTLFKSPENMRGDASVAPSSRRCQFQISQAASCRCFGGIGFVEDHHDGGDDAGPQSVLVAFGGLDNADGSSRFRRSSCTAARAVPRLVGVEGDAQRRRQHRGGEVFAQVFGLLLAHAVAVVLGDVAVDVVLAGWPARCRRR